MRQRRIFRSVLFILGWQSASVRAAQFAANDEPYNNIQPIDATVLLGLNLSEQ